jgi:glucosamine--fructose-6-phosphate aminotransferase (isomerizing)
VTRSISDYRLYAQIRSQPAELDRVLSAPEPIEDAADAVAEARRVVTIGIGTSWNAASAGGWMLRAAGLDATAWSSADFALYPPDLGERDAAIVYTHSGAKRFSKDALAWLRDRGVATVLLTSTASELTAGEIGEGTTVIRTVPRETSAMFTVSHTAAMLMTARVADAVRAGAVGDLTAVAPAVSDALELEDRVADLAQAWHGRRSLIALGGGPHEVSAHEVAIKVAEAARYSVRAHAVEQFLHGPQVQVRDDEACLVFAGPGAVLERSRDAAIWAQLLGTHVAWVSSVEGPEGSAWLPVTDVGEQLAPLVEIVPGQLLAGHLAALADVDGDNFRLDHPGMAEGRDRFGL